MDGDNVRRKGLYDSNQLYVTKTSDEDGCVSYVFTDKLGRQVLLRHMKGSTCNDTYYVYDDFGLLRYVLPNCTVGLTSTTVAYNISTLAIANYGYYYKYDHRNRCIEKKLPGAGAIYYEYDSADRLILTQDREHGGNWMFSIPDVFGRTVLTGIVSGKPVITGVVKGEYTGATNPFYGYTLSGITFTANQQQSYTAFTVNYYDNYKFKSLPGFSGDSNFAYGMPADFANTRYGDDQDLVKAKGQLTGSQVFAVGGGFASGKPIYSVFYYDDRNRIIQTVSSNQLVGYDKEYFDYSTWLADTPQKKRVIHSVVGSAAVTENYSYIYDDAGRLKDTEYTLDNNTASKTYLSRLTYDEMCRLKTKQLGNAYETISYKYNVRNWVKEINSNRFQENLYYNESVSGNTPVYNGNISALTWKTASSTTLRGYNFTYDQLNQLTSAIYRKNGAADGSYDATYGYSGRQLTTLGRYYNFGTTSATRTTIDALLLSYNGNRLSKVEESQSASDWRYGFYKPDSYSGEEYGYNNNGAMIHDYNSGISRIYYNSLHLPSQVMFAYGHSIIYTYDGLGNKHKAVYKTVKSNLNVPMGASDIPNQSANLQSTLEVNYCGRFIHENRGAVKRILLPDGYVDRSSTGAYTFYYYLKDHLGNNRVVINTSGTATVQEMNYYPFGMAYLDRLSTDSKNPGLQPYKYGGKEYDTMYGLNWYDFHARQKMGQLPGFTTMDPLCEKYPWISPYAYCANNPVNAIDLRGDSVTVLNLGTGTDQHMAILIQNDAGKWQYFSVNGDNVYIPGTDIHFGGRKFDDLAVGEFDSPQQFMDSYYNQAGDKDDKSINSYGFTEGYVLPTTSEQDNTIRSTFTDISQNESYNIFTNNCATVVQKSLNAAGVETKVNGGYIAGKQRGFNTFIPSDAFGTIKTNNPNGIYIRSNKKQ